MFWCLNSRAYILDALNAGVQSGGQETGAQSPILSATKLYNYKVSSDIVKLSLLQLKVIAKQSPKDGRDVFHLKHSAVAPISVLIFTE